MSAHRGVSIEDLLWLEDECLVYYLYEPEHELGLCNYLQSKTSRDVYTMIHCIRDEYEGSTYADYVSAGEGPTPKRLAWVHDTLLPAIRNAIRGIPGDCAEDY